MKVILVTLFLILSTMPHYGQKFNFGIGLEVNKVDLKKKAPTGITSPYSIGLNPSVGMSGHLIIEYKINDYFFVSLNPSYGTYRMSIDKSRNSSFLYMNHLNIGLGSRVNFDGLTGGFEFGVSRFSDLYYTQPNQYRDLTKYIINKNILNYAFFVGFDIYKDSYIYIKTSSYLQDYFAIAGYDNIGREISPIVVRPKYLSLGINYIINDKD